MRFISLVKATKDTEAGVMPEEKLIGAMADYHEQLEDFGPSEAIERFREMGVGTKS